MARNYQIGEAVEIIAKGDDVEAIQDLGRRYPLLVAKVAKATSGSNSDAVVELFRYMPEYLSANKVNKTIKQILGGDVPADDDAEAEVEAEDEKPAKKAAVKKATTKKSNDPYAGKDAITLFKECKKRGIKAAPKKTAKYYADLLKKADAEAAAEEAEAEDDGWDDDEEEEAPKKKATAKKGKKAEPEPEPDDDDDDDDDWDI